MKGAPSGDPLCASIAERLVQDQVAPDAALACARRSDRGWLCITGVSHGITRDTPFDLASVSKPFVAVTAARLAQSGMIGLDTPLEELLDEASGTPAGSFSLELLLAHRAGLEAHRELFLPLKSRRAVSCERALQSAATALRAECRGKAAPAGFAPVYSDLGYLLVGFALERAFGTPLDELVDREVAAPLGLRVASARLWLDRDARFAHSVPPTEHVAWRGGTLRGVVHDENAWALAGHGLCGHAGLFGTAEAVARFGAAVIDALLGRRPEWLERELAERLVRPRPGGTLRAGFDGKQSTGSSAGSRAGPDSFGHLGFTGTSLWCDPRAESVAVLLTNRVHPTREHLAIREARPAVHDALFERAERLPDELPERPDDPA